MLKHRIRLRTMFCQTVLILYNIFFLINPSATQLLSCMVGTRLAHLTLCFITPPNVYTAPYTKTYTLTFGIIPISLSQTLLHATARYYPKDTQLSSPYTVKLNTIKNKHSTKKWKSESSSVSHFEFWYYMLVTANFWSESNSALQHMLWAGSYRLQ